MKNNKFILAFLMLFSLASTKADNNIPSISPVAILQGEDGEEEVTSFSGSAPLEVSFRANPKNHEGWSEYYEWRFTTENNAEPFLIRYDENTEYTFKQAGSTKIVCYAIFTNGGDTVSFTKEYWDETEPITISISESRLDMPNAFSPNGDGINDIYKAKEGYQSLVEFHAAIYNRWGQKLYEWTDPADGWDGKFNGKDVAQGVYFCRVEAKGADGIKYHFKRDVNLLRGYNENKGTTSE